MSIEVMTVMPTAIEGLQLVTMKAVTDERGTVREFYRASEYGFDRVPSPKQWAQINLTWTRKGGVRGLHGESMTKLVGVAAGQAFGAYVDARAGSATFGTVVTLSLAVGQQVFVPPGVCNGFQAISDGGCEYMYCFDREWVPAMAGVMVNPLDPELAIAWPLPPQLSQKDLSAPSFSDLRI